MQAARRLHARRPRGGAPPGRRGDDARRRRGRCKSGFRFSPRRAGGIRADSAGPTGNPLPVTPPNRPRSDPTSWRPAEAPKAPNPRCKAVLRASAPPKKPGMVRKGLPVRVRPEGLGIRHSVVSPAGSSATNHFGRRRGRGPSSGGGLKKAMAVIPRVGGSAPTPILLSLSRTRVPSGTASSPTAGPYYEIG